MSMNQLTIPNKLYGRHRDIITMFESFERISSGHGEVLLIPGSSRVGKTCDSFLMLSFGVRLFPKETSIVF